MQSVTSIAFKDLVLLLRDKSSLFWVAAMPLIMAVLFGAIFGGGSTMSDVKVAVVDLDQTSQSRAFVKRLEQAKGLVRVRVKDLDAAKQAVRKGDLIAYVLIKKGFGTVHGMSPGNGDLVEVGIDPSRKAEKGFLKGAVTEALFKGFKDLFSNPAELRGSIHRSIQELKQEGDQDAPLAGMAQGVTKTSLLTFLEATEKWLATANPKDMQAGMNMKEPVMVSVARSEGDKPATAYEVTFPASTIWGVLGIVAAFAALIARERTQGTLLRFRVIPLSWAKIAAGKGLSAFLAYLAMSATMLLLGALIFSIRIPHPVQLLMALAASGITVMGLVLLVAPMGRTEQAVSGAAWGVMMPFAIFGGATIPLAMMPGWMKAVSNLSPLKWSVLAMEGAIWRNFSITEMLLPCAILLLIGALAAAVGVFLLSRRGVL